MSARTLDRIETERMVFERLRPEHATELSSLLLDPRVASTLWPHLRAPSEEDVLHSLGERLTHWERFGFGLWLLRDSATGEMVGRGGLQWTEVQGTREVEVGWAITPARWREGLATELAHAALGVAFDELSLKQVVALALPDNVASRRVMEKAEFEYERKVIYAGMPHVLYRRRAPC